MLKKPAELIASWTLLVLLCVPSAAGAKTVIKIATVAPRGSMWMRVLNKLKARVSKETGGEVKLRYYPGQVQGDERDVVRKMRTGQLQGGAFTTIGLSMINPQVLVMQMPLMFNSYAQYDKVRKKMTPDFERSFLAKGYVLLGWGEIGEVHMFTKNRVTGIAEMRKQRVWVWSDDAISKAMMRKLKIRPRALGLPQVYPALNTGMVNAVTNSPLGCMALQWHTKVKYILSDPLAIGIGATVITKKIWDKLSPAHQAALKKFSFKYHEYLLKRIRRDNAKAKKALLAGGITAIRMPAADKKKYIRAAAQVARSFVPRYYPQSILNKVRSLR